MLKGRSERREKEIVEVVHSILKYLPEKHDDLTDKILHNNVEKGYSIQIKNKELVLIEGNGSYSKMNGADVFDEKNCHVLKSFTNDSDFSQFKRHLTDAVKDSPCWTNVQNLDRNAVKVQSAVRCYFVRRPQDKKTEVPAIRNAEGRIIGRKIDGRFVAEPPLIANHSDKNPEGTFKILTHRDSRGIEDADKFICGAKNRSQEGMTPKQKQFQVKVQEVKAWLNTDSVKAKFWGQGLVPQVGLTLKNPAEYEPLAKPVLEAIKGSKYFIRQTQVNERLLFSPDMGENLEVMIEKPRSNFTFTTATPIKNLAAELDRIHGLGIAHRDIKPANMFMLDKEICLADLDSMGVVGTFTNFFGTSSYFPVEAFLTNTSPKEFWQTQNREGIAIKQDQYCFLNSMMHLYFKSLNFCIDGEFLLFKREQFCDVFINDCHKQAVLSFLADPMKNSIPSLLEILK